MVNNDEHNLFPPTITLAINDSTIVAVNDAQIDYLPALDLGSLGLRHDKMNGPNSYESDDVFL